MKLFVDTNNASRVERHIAPPMRLSITLPVLVEGIDGMDPSVVVYVATSPFAPQALDDRQLRRIAAVVARRIGTNLAE